MTICLAAICKDKNKEYIIFSTDHMVTTSIGQFEHSIKKYKEVNCGTVAMLAGNPLIFDKLINLANKNCSYQEIKKEIFENFKKFRAEGIKNEIFDMFGIDKKYFLDVLDKPVPNPFIARILEKVCDYTLDTGILLIGFDGDEAQITEISEDGVEDFRMMNFHAIGSGNIQAANALLFQKHDKEEGLFSSVYNVYKAKKNAEVLQGVGKETDLLILDKERGCIKIFDKDLNILNDIYKNELKYGKENPKLKELDLGGLNAQQKL